MTMRLGTLLCALLGLAAWPVAAQGPSPAEKPSAELITEAEETIINEPSLEPGEEPLPQMDAPFPGEADIFGDDLFGTPSGAATGVAGRAPRMPSPLPVLEDPLEAQRKMRIRLAKIKARLDRDPRLVELEEMAAAAPTPEDRRAARRAYYALFFEMVRRADVSLKGYADELEKQSLAGLYQTRVDPTWPLVEPPQPQPQARFIPPRQYPDVLPADEQPVALP
jgi:hypothetical protein